MDTGTNRAQTRFHWLKLTIKIVVIAGCAWYISGKIDLARTREVLQQANWFFLFPALALFLLSKLISAIRLRVYFSNIRLPLTFSENIRLYWLGMFYNLFLPGAISGDIYKVILLSKKFNTPYKKLTAAVVLDRFSGLLGLGILLAGLSFFVHLPAGLPALISVTAIGVTVLFYFILRHFFPDFLTGFTSTLLLGIAVQAVQLGCIYMIIQSLGISNDVPACFFIFLLSSAVSVLPLTIGGLGIRELVFLQGAAWFHTGAETAVLISLLFYFLTLVSSVWGLTWIFKNPLNEKGLSDEPLIS